MTREAGMMYLPAFGLHGSEITDENLRDPFCTALETSTDGKLGYIRLPAELSRLTIPSGTAVRVPSAIGANLAQNRRWRDLSSEDFYSRGHDQPDAYALQDEVKELKAEAQDVEKAAVDFEKEITSLKAEVKKLKKAALTPSQKPPKLKPTKKD